MANPTNKDYYDILGVAKDASVDDIKKAFRVKARTMHPDVSKEPDAEAKFKELSEAYDTLSDPDKRARYDAVRTGGFTTENPFRPSGSGEGSGYTYGSPNDPFGWSAWGFPFGGYGGYSTQTSGRAGGAHGVPYVSEQGATRRIKLSLKADEAKKGCAKSVSYNHYETCPDCHGRGSAQGHSAESCPLCHGTGRLETVLGGFYAAETRCAACGGSGKVIKNPCTTCGGSGRVERNVTTRVEIPASSHDGGSMRVAAMGDAGRCGGASGDLEVEFVVPSEHLTHNQEMLFTSLGVIVSVFLCTVFASTVIRIFAFFALPLFFVFFFVSPSLRLMNKGGSFAQRAARRFGLGLVVGVFVFILLSPLMSCVGRF